MRWPTNGRRHETERPYTERSDESDEQRTEGTEGTERKGAAPRRTPDARSRPRRVPWYVGLPVTLAAILAVFLAAAKLDLLPGLPNPFAERQIDRSQPAVLKSIQDMSRYTAAGGNFQVIVDLDQDAKFLPSQILGKRTLYVAAGTVDAYVDLGELANGAVTVSDDRRSATVTLPHARLADPALDVKRSYVFSQQRGLFDRLGDFFSGNPGDQQKLEILATDKIKAAAEQTALTATAEKNTRAMLQNLLTSLGFTTVTVTVVR
ncbi:DUF4230 domain-containing protein [Kitasatospora sp. NPDC005748]|uniref:DUF4230 domain-containing protein n=1 Tax=Kitasatospora sp. NPDC005748 TaxID=3157063 RepID=UPI0033EB2BD0